MNCEHPRAVQSTHRDLARRRIIRQCCSCWSQLGWVHMRDDDRPVFRVVPS